MILPKFTFNSTNFTPAYPAKNKLPLGVNKLTAVKHNSIASAGQKQSNTERIEEYQPIEFPFIASGDLASFRSMVIWGMNGGVITYFPDSTDASTHADFYLETEDWEPKFVMTGTYSGTLLFRKVVT